MQGAVDLVEVWRGELREAVHQGHAVVSDAQGHIVAAWGDPGLVSYPRSSAKMLQALPLVESGAADAWRLTPQHLALACASHIGAACHTDRVAAWIGHLGLTEDALRCGVHEPGDRDARDALTRAGRKPCQWHNNCSGKHAGFLTLNRHLRGGPDYELIDHPVQQAARAAFEEVTDAPSPAWGIDGCSAPSFATPLAAMARAMAQFATAGRRGGVRAAAQVRLVAAMIAHPELVNGEGRSCTELMRACGGKAALKGGAEGNFVAILPDRGLGVAIKVMDGSDRGKEAAIAALLIRLGVLDAGHPAALRLTGGPQRNWRGTVVGQVRAAAGLAG